MRTRIPEAPPWYWAVQIGVCAALHLFGGLRHWPLLDYDDLSLLVFWIAVAVCWLLLGWVISPAGVERYWGPWRVWSVTWDQYAGWRWMVKETVIGRNRVLAPDKLAICDREGRHHLITVHGQRLEGERVVPGRKGSRLIAALWEHGPHIGTGWQQTVGYVELVSTAEATDEFPAVTAPL